MFGSSDLSTITIELNIQEMRKLIQWTWSDLHKSWGWESRGVATVLKALKAP